MKQKDSIILKILNGERGALDTFPLSDDYFEAFTVYKQKNEEFEKLIKKDARLLTLYRGVIEALLQEHVVYADDMYKEGFTLGLALGQEVFSKKFD